MVAAEAHVEPARLAPPDRLARAGQDDDVADPLAEARPAVAEDAVGEELGGAAAPPPGPPGGPRAATTTSSTWPGRTWRKRSRADPAGASGRPSSPRRRCRAISGQALVHEHRRLGVDLHLAVVGRDEEERLAVGRQGLGERSPGASSTPVAAATWASEPGPCSCPVGVDVVDVGDDVGRAAASQRRGHPAAQPPPCLNGRTAAPRSVARLKVVSAIAACCTAAERRSRPPPGARRRSRRG